MDLTSDIIFLENDRLLNLLSMYLNNAPKSLTAEDIEPLLEFGISKEQAFSMALAGILGLDIADKPEDERFFLDYFPQMVHHLSTQRFKDDPYYANVLIPQAESGTSKFKMLKIEPYEGFVCNDIFENEEGRVIPQVGFFDEPFEFPAVLEDGRVWMTLAPNEIESQRQAIADAHGDVVMFGLGLGYYAYMVSEKPDVKSVTIVELNEDIIDLFESHILDQFPHKDKIRIVHGDAFEFAEKQLPAMEADFAYTDLWHDVGDGIKMYKRMKKLEPLSPNTQFSYWIEQTMLCYL